MKYRTLIIIIIVLIGVIILFAMGRRGASQEHSDVDDTIDVSMEGATIKTEETQFVVANEPELEESYFDGEPPAIEEIMAKDFTLPRYGGGEITLSSYRDEKPVILDFWTTWCPSCRQDMPAQNKLYEQYKEDVEVIAINMNEKRSIVDAYIEKNNFSLPFVYDDNTVVNDYSIQLTNTHVLINKDGTIYDIFPGDIDEKHFQALIKNNQ